MRRSHSPEIPANRAAFGLTEWRSLFGEDGLVQRAVDPQRRSVTVSFWRADWRDCAAQFPVKQGIYGENIMQTGLSATSGAK
jgi:hypothetical protein